MNKIIRVLNVEDRESDVALLTRHLSRAGYDIVSKRVETPDAMKAALESAEWDVILSDYSMPHFSALGALALLKETGLDIPFIIISGTVGEAVAVEAMRAGANDYLMKDNLMRLGPTIERELHEAENRRARKIAEESLKASEAELLALLAAISDVIFVIDTQGRFLGLAPTDPTHLYKTASEMVGKTLHELFPQPKADMFLGHIGRVLEEGRTKRLEYNLEVEGFELWFEGSVSPMSKSTVVWVAREITERKHAEDKNRTLLHDLGERVKELTALHRASRILQGEWTDTSTLLLEIIELLPQAFQYPEVTAARVRLGELEATTQRWANSQSILRADFATADGQPGSLEVVYTESWPSEAEGPFLSQEFELINTLADMLRTAYDHAQAALALRESEGRFRQLAENIREVFWMRTPDIGEILYVSPAFDSVWGISRETLNSDPRAYIESMHPDDRQRIAQIMEKEQERGFEVEYRIITPDGRLRWIWDRGFPIKDELGGVYRIAGIAEDITERKHAEQELTKSEERYRDLVENAHDIIYSHDLEGNYTSVNKAAERITGYTREEVLKMNFAETVAPEYLDKSRQMLAKKLAGAEETVDDLEIIAKDRRRIAVEVNSRLIYRDGVAVGVQGIARDVTERKQLEEQLRQSQKMEAVGQLAGGVAHDFNNLLTAITGYSDLSLRKMDPRDPLFGNLQEVKMASERAASLTRQLLAFSRKQVMQPKVLDLNSVVADLDKMLRRMIGENIDLRSKLSSQLGRVKADRGQIEQVLMNLVVNARDAIPELGVITIETENIYLEEEYAGQHIAVQPGPHVKLAVTDNGCGMDEAVRARIFEPFYTTKEQGKGTGLGLSTVYGIVKQSKGSIWVYSEVGQGTTFKIYLPHVDGEADRAQQGEGQQKLIARSGETVLLVEDDELVRRMAHTVLELEGYKVIEARNGREALKICLQYANPIHLMLTDVVMPEMSGPAAADQVKEMHPEMRVLYMSGYTEDAIVHHGVLDEGVNFIEKPFTPDALAHKVREVLST
jgi:two-component system cell cycle sensor histidine kinase/response regulator CckA